MSQTPARDFIAQAEVDFRFYTKTARNFANTVHEASPTTQLEYRLQNGVWALSGNSFPQSWMLAAQTEFTIEVLLCKDLWAYYDQILTTQSCCNIINGDWNIGFGWYADPVIVGFNGYTFYAGLQGQSFEAGVLDSEMIVQNLNESTTPFYAAHPGSPLHLIFSTRSYTGLVDVVTMMNGHYSSNLGDTATAMTAEPTNTIGVIPVSGNNFPMYLFRMWSSFTDDEDVMRDLWQDSRKILCNQTFPQVLGDVKRHILA